MKKRCFFYLTTKRHCSSLTTSLINPNPTITRKTQHKVPEILNHCKSGSLLHALHLLNSTPLKSISNKPLLYASLLQTCAKINSFNQGLQIHAHLVKSGLDSDRFVGNSLLTLYFKLGGGLFDARRVFDALYYRDVISWTCMITGYVKAKKPLESVGLFREMLGFDVKPNGFTLSAVVKACAELCDLRLGLCFHCVVLVRGFGSNCVISSALIDLYGRCCRVDDARRLFDEFSEVDGVCCTSLLSAFTRSDMYVEALNFFCSARRDHGMVLLDGFIVALVLTACGNLSRLKQGKEVHSKSITCGFSGNVYVESSLVDMYGKCKRVRESQLIFDRMSVKNAVSWSALLDGYCQNGDFASVLRIFKEVKEVDLYSFGTVIRACAGLAAIGPGKEVHCQYVRRGGGERDVIVESALIDLYAKCGCVDFACIIFNDMPVRNLITWNAMLSGFAQNGRGREAVQLFHQMIDAGVRPDNISFIAVLTACSHTGLVDRGRKFFVSMTEEYGIKPGIEHYNCMVDLLGRAGLLEEAESLVEKADCRSKRSLWEVLLGACATSTNSVTVERIAKKTMELAPDCHLSYVYLANFYRALGRWGDAAKIWKLMEKRGAKKKPGKSWILTDDYIGTSGCWHSPSAERKLVQPWTNISLLFRPTCSAR